MLKIIDKITKEHVFEDLESKDKESLFRALSEKIATGCFRLCRCYI